jgi:hypothetical protein
MTLTWPAAFLIFMLVFLAVVVFGTPARTRHAEKMAEIKAKSGEQHKEISAKYEALAVDLHTTQAAMQVGLAKLAASVESIEKMMRDVG